MLSTRKGTNPVSLAVALNDDPAASTLRHEAGLYGILSLFLGPMLFLSAHRSLHNLGIRASLQTLQGAHIALQSRAKGRHAKPQPSLARCIGRLL